MTPQKTWMWDEGRSFSSVISSIYSYQEATSLIRWWLFHGWFLGVWWLGKNRGNSDQPFFYIVNITLFYFPLIIYLGEMGFRSGLVPIFVSLTPTWKVWGSVFMDHYILEGQPWSGAGGLGVRQRACKQLFPVAVPAGVTAAVCIRFPSSWRGSILVQSEHWPTQVYTESVSWSF